MNNESVQVQKLHIVILSCLLPAGAIAPKATAKSSDFNY